MIDLSANALEILEARYLLKNEVMETPDGLFKRVAKHISSIEEKNQQLWFKRFYALMRNLEFLPNSPTLMNANLPNGQLSACFVLPVEDSLASIFNTLKEAAIIHKSGGGTGFNFSKLRPKNDALLSSRGTSSGPVSFMKIYDTATAYVKQAGKRRGANMGILNIDHPDIEEFIIAKTDGRSLQNFNISVGITDDFMTALNQNKDWQFINPRTHKPSKTIKAKVLWDLIVEQAHRTGDPGLIFLDTINKDNPLPKQGKILSTNPCGEVPLFDFESCNLGSINLTKMLNESNEKPVMDWEKVEKTVNTAIRFLDNVISANHYLLPKIEQKTLKNRKIGLGVMGWAELLILLDIPYASGRAVKLAEKTMKFIKEKSYKASADLAKERGPFPSWKESRFAPKYPMRNATCNSIAPTGSISAIANTSYSIEPLYALAYKRIGILTNRTQTEINSVFVKKMKSLGLWTKEVEAAILTKGNIQHIKSLTEETKKLFETSLDIPWKYHLRHQQAFQKYTDNAVSKTINLPENTAVNVVSRIYKTAWEFGLKGITIYRNQSRENQVHQICGNNSSDECD